MRITSIVALIGALAAPLVSAGDFDNRGLLEQYVKVEELRQSMSMGAGNVQAGILAQSEGVFRNRAGATVTQTLEAGDLSQHVDYGAGNLQVGVGIRGIGGIENRGTITQRVLARNVDESQTRTAMSTQAIIYVGAGTPSAGAATDAALSALPFKR